MKISIAALLAFLMGALMFLPVYAAEEGTQATQAESGADSKKESEEEEPECD